MPNAKLTLASRTCRRLLASIFPYIEDVWICHTRGRYAGRQVNRVIVGPDKFWEIVDISKGIFISKIFVYSITKCAMRKFHDRTFHVAVLHTRNCTPSSRNMSWKYLYRNSLTLSLRNHNGRREFFGSSSNLDRNFEATEGPLFLFTGIRYINFEDTSMTECICDYHYILSKPVHLPNQIPTHP